MQTTWDETRELQVELSIDGYVPVMTKVGRFSRFIFDVTHGSSLSYDLSDILDKALIREHLCGDEDLDEVPADLFIKFRSVGFYDGGCTYGPPENCYPPEGDDERTMLGVRLVFGDDEVEIPLTPEEQEKIFEEFEDQVDRYELDD